MDPRTTIEQPPTGTARPQGTIFRAEAVQRYQEGQSSAAAPALATGMQRPLWSKAAGRFVQPRRGRRVPVRRQLTMVECGAACLAMILSHHGRVTAVAECRTAMDIGRGGATARTIAQAARSYGLRVRAFSLGPGQLANLQLPAIAHWQFDHFVVLERWSPGRVEIIDPAQGRRRLTAAEFDAGFTIAAGILGQVEAGGWRCGVPLGAEMPGLMTGLAGIGYGLLRLAEPQGVPSVLVLAPPVAPRLSGA